jgi:hypothetical protein
MTQNKVPSVGTTNMGWETSSITVQINQLYSFSPQIKICEMVMTLPGLPFATESVRTKPKMTISEAVAIHSKC